MRVLVAGAGGAIGRQLLPRLVERGHEVVGMTRGSRGRRDGAGAGRGAGGRRRARPREVAPAVADAEPEAIVHQLTSLSGLARPAPLRPRRSRSPTGFAPRAPTTCSPPAAPSGFERVRRPELRRLAVTPASGGPVKDESDAARPRAARRDGRDAGRDPATRGGGYAAPGRAGSSFDTGAFTGPGTSLDPGRASTHELIEGGRCRSSAAGRALVVRPHRRCRRGHRRRDRAWGGRASTTSSTTSRRRSASGCPPCSARAGGEAATPRAALARTPARRRGRGGHDDRGAEAPRTRRRSASWAGRPATRSWRSGIAEAVGVTDSRESQLDELRPGAFAVAYRMLGSVGDAEEVVQEAMLRLNGALERGERIESPRA